MSETNAPPSPPDASAPAAGEQPVTATSTPFDLVYADVSRTVATGQDAEVALVGNRNGSPVRLSAALKDPLRFREAMSALHAIVGSDYRYVPKDRAAYAAFVRMRRQSAGLSVWKSQQAYFSFLLRNDPAATLILDPVVTVHPDQVFFEVFSKDEGIYAKLGIDRGAFDLEADPVFGTTHIDLGQPLFDGLQQMRSFRKTRLTIGREATQPPAEAGGSNVDVLEKHINVPDSWLRGFLQVQASAALPADVVSVAPIDLYNLLRQLRLRADTKGKRRGLRIELLPGEQPRIVLEPWETVLTLTAEPYRGRAAKVVRLWGRRRLLILRRLLPFVDRVDVHLLGSGLPSFWVLRAKDITLTLGLTGFTAANWSQAVSFDLLLPRTPPPADALKAIVKHLEKSWFASASDIAAATKLKGAALTHALQAGCQQGRLMFDLAYGVYRLRPLTDTPLDLARLEYRNQRERIAHDLLARRSAVRIVSENRLATIGLELTGKVTVDEDRREYRPQMLLTDEGQISKAECTCTLFRTQGLKQGPCVHLIALRLCYAEQEARRMQGGGDRGAVVVETRSYSRRDERGQESVIQLSLERQKLKIRRGRAGDQLRLQTLWFNSADEARSAYFAEVNLLATKGYLDASA